MRSADFIYSDRGRANVDAPVPSGLVQRACACGGKAEGECESCRKQLSVEPALGVQAKLTVNRPDDPFEREADRMADRVVQRQEVEEEEELQTKPLSVQREMGEEEEELQTERSPGATPRVTPAIEAGIRGLSQGGGRPLPTAVRGTMEPHFGHSFADVRVHTDSRAAGLASGLKARAFTVGRDVVFGAGQYDPQSSVGQRLLAHELTHTVQQGAVRRQERSRR